MAEFRNRVLAILDRIYGFTAAKSYTDKLDLNSPIQLTHDTSREAEVGSAYGLHGGFSINTVCAANHVGASTIRNTIDAYTKILSPGSGGGIDPVLNPVGTEVDAWIIAQQMYVSATNASKITAAINVNGDILPETTLTTWPLFYGTTSQFYASNWAGTGDVLEEVNLIGATYGKNYTFPFRVPHDSRFALRSESTGAMNTEWRLLLWIGRKGTAPPGMP